MFVLLALMYLCLSRSAFCLFLRTSGSLTISSLYRTPDVNFPAWIPPTPHSELVWNRCRQASRTGQQQRRSLTSKWREDPSTSPFHLAAVSCSILSSSSGKGNHRQVPLGAPSSVAQQSLLHGAEPQRAGAASSVPSQDVSTGGMQELQSVEIDATLDGISREGLLQLLGELKRQTPELLRLLPSQQTSALDSLSTEQLRSLVEQLLNLAEAADVHTTADSGSVSSDKCSTTASRGQLTPLQVQPAPQTQHAKQQVDTETSHKREKWEPKKHKQKDRPEKDSGADVQPLQCALAQAESAASAAASAACVEAQQLLEIGTSEEVGEGLFSALQEQMPLLQEADIWDLLVAMGPVLQALLPPENPPREQPLLGQQRMRESQQQGTTENSVEALLDATAEERQALALEAAAINQFVEAKVGPLSWAAKKDLLLTLLAVVEAEGYCPKEPEVRQLLGLDTAGVGVPRNASAAGAAATGVVSEQAESMKFGGLPVVSAWRRLLQLPENALEGENPLSADEAEALSAEEVKLRYLRVIKQARQASIKASLKLCDYVKQSESSFEGPGCQSLPEENLAGISSSERTLENQAPITAGSPKPHGSGNPNHSLRQVSGSDCLRGRLDARAVPPPMATNPEAALQESAKPAISEAVPPRVCKRAEKPDVAVESTTTAVSTASSGTPILYNGAAVHRGRGGDAHTQEETLMDLSRKSKVPKPDSAAAGDSEDTSYSRKLTGLTGGTARFAALGLNTVVSSAAAAFLGGAASKPTPTQRLVVPHILKAFKKTESCNWTAGKSSIDSLVALRAHTGSGKTLAFLLPLMQALRDQEVASAAADKCSVRDELEYADLMDCKALEETVGGHHDASRTFVGSGRPRALVICPSRPLASQVASVAAALAKRIRLSVGCTTGGVGAGDQLRLLRRRPVDVLIGTPDRLLRLTRPSNTESRHFETGERSSSTQRATGGLPSLDYVQFCILDEADASWHGGFREDVEKLLIRSRFLHTASQQIGEQERKWAYPKVLLTCTATPDSGVEADLCTLLELPAEKVFTVSGGPPFPPQAQLRHEMMQSRGADRFLLLVEQIKIHPELRAKKILVFCNTVDSCRACCHHLQAADLPAEGYDGSLPASVREKNLRSFQEGNGQRILVATDAVARGLHIGGVDAVVNADFPRTTVEYLHRAGRTGRVESKGFVLSFVSKRDAALAAAVRASLSVGLSVEEAGGRSPREERLAGYRSRMRMAKSKSKARRGGWKPPRPKEWHAARVKMAQRLEKRQQVREHFTKRRVGSANKKVA
ncbi:DEAD/DEAH box helicase, putative [Eimeria maxima]|uniref:ATP-dependent RNA helicase n=1 Tax=Eimeria maxima TaxID=5804 RepID=U6MDW3_EIMMA|nr:DEAD/DEAH box helicase, putative [Eimeria maxima]CDJ59865.1 DEAD/DEAH box helicase, putative [Eimeria maxima]